MFLTLGRTEDALKKVQDGLKIMRVLAEADPSDARKQRALTGSHYKIGTVLQAFGEFRAAAESFDAAAAIVRSMIERGINVEQSTSDLASLESSARSARLGEAAIGDWEKLLQHPAESLPAVLDLRGTQFTKRSHFTEAAQAATKLRELENADNGHLYNAACVFSLCAASIRAAEGSELTAEQTTQRQTWINEAIAALKQSIAKGWTDFAHMQQDPDLTILRDLPEFKALIPAPPAPEPPKN